MTKKNEEKKAIYEWLKEYDFAIMDADGFDRNDPDLNKRKFTRKEFEKRASLCTCVGKDHSLYEILKEKGFNPEYD